MPPHPLTIFEIQKYYENEPKLNDVYQSIEIYFLLMIMKRMTK